MNGEGIMNGECVTESGIRQAHKDSIIVMTRVPYPGATKTRLMPHLTPQQCVELHAAFLNDLKTKLEILSAFDIDIHFAIAPEHSDSIHASLIPDLGTHFHQRGDTLGERMQHALKTVLEVSSQPDVDRPYERRVILIGSDIPQITVEDMKNALSALENHDAVIAPTLDGGYWLIGMKSLHSHLFEEMHNWGGDNVFESTITSLASKGLTYFTGTCYQDVDTFDDIKALYESMDQLYLLNNTQKWCDMYFDKPLTEANG